MRKRKIIRIKILCYKAIDELKHIPKSKFIMKIFMNKVKMTKSHKDLYIDEDNKHMRKMQIMLNKG